MDRQRPLRHCIADLPVRTPLISRLGYDLLKSRGGLPSRRSQGDPEPPPSELLQKQNDRLGNGGRFARSGRAADDRQLPDNRRKCCNLLPVRPPLFFSARLAGYDREKTIQPLPENFRIDPPLPEALVPR